MYWTPLEIVAFLVCIKRYYLMFLRQLILQWITWADGFVCCYNAARVESFDLVPKCRSEITEVKKLSKPPFTLVATNCTKLVKKYLYFR